MSDSTFNLDSWTERLARCLELELLHWQTRLSIESLRGFALDCHPWLENTLTLSLLTDREKFDEERRGKWAIAEWRFYDFTSAPTEAWPAAKQLMLEARGYYTRGLAAEEQSAAHSELLRCCVLAMGSPRVAHGLSRYQLASDFERFVGHPDSPSRNFYVS